jgi:hypothetical protein
MGDILLNGIMCGNEKLENGRMGIRSGCGLLQSVTEIFARRPSGRSTIKQLNTWLPVQELNPGLLKCEEGMLMSQLSHSLSCALNRKSRDLLTHCRLL